MAHSHEHSHGNAGENDYSRAFALGIGLNIAFVAVEIIYGLIANSSALLADAGHNASDVLGLVFAWTASRLATIKPKGKYTYGLRKTTILVSILNALLLFGAVTAIGWDAVEKLYNPEPVAGTPVMIVAAIGVVINTLTALLFMKGQKEDLNIKGAFLHMAADAGVSLGVVVAGLLINITGLQWIDPITSFLIIAVILWGTWNLFTDSVDLALDAVPKQIDVDQVRDFLLSQKGVQNVHDLHIWAMSTTKVALSVHIITSVQTDGSFIQEIQESLHEKFNIGHTTIQIEFGTVLKDCCTNCN
ncbi:MAG: cation diffusion facilitator family transporter [Bacteroidales bacterium]|nr:cation diffusion facilitator family transporter [Bacteroidales bacterium]